MTATTDMRDLYIAAEAAVLKGQSYRFGDRYLTRADLSEIRAGRREWEVKVDREAAGPGASRGYAVADFSGEGCRSNFRRAE